MTESPNTSNAVEPSENDRALALLWQRVYAAETDVIILGVASATLFFSAGPLTSTPHWPWMPAAVVLGAFVLWECLTGQTPGKSARHLSLRSQDGSKARWWMLWLRGLMRHVPLIGFLISMMFRTQPANVSTLFSAFVVALCYISGSYITILRTGLTLFDLVAGTQLVATSRDKTHANL